jgi:heme-degrading monooxygenase HmoA
MMAASFPTPYYAVVFSSLRTPNDHEHYGETAQRMDELAQQQPGFLGVESVRGEDGLGITVSYWRDEASILAWKNNAEHCLARELGRSRWYQAFTTRVSRVEREYSFTRDESVRHDLA